MLTGNIQIKDGVLRTRTGRFSLSPDIDAIADQSLLIPGTMTAVLISGFGFAFGDPLTPTEIKIIAAIAIFSSLFGLLFARLVIIKASLRGTEHSTIAYGTFYHVRQLADDIVETAREVRL